MRAGYQDEERHGEDFLTVSLAVERPYDAEALLAYLGARAIAGMEVVAGFFYRRVVVIDDLLRVFEVDFSRAATLGTIRASCNPGHRVTSDALRRLVAPLVDADAPVDAIARHLSSDPRLAPLVERRPGLRIPGTVDPFELAVRAIVGQQVSVAAARTLASRLVDRWGERMAEPRSGLAQAFPTAKQLRKASLEEIGLPRTRATAIRGLADASARGLISLDREQSRGRVADGLLDIPGIGPWTASYVALRGLGDRDAIPVTDLGIRQVLAGRGDPLRPSEVSERAETWKPWRGYGAVHLWMTFLE